MSLISRSLLASTLLIATLAAPSGAQTGGFGGGPGGGLDGIAYAGPGLIAGKARIARFSRNESPAVVFMDHVVISHAGDLSDAVRQLVAAEVAKSLRRSADDSLSAQIRSISISMPIGASAQNFMGFNLGDDAAIQALTIQVAGPEGAEEPLDDAHYAKLWDQARQKLEVALRKAQQRIVRQRHKDYNYKESSIINRLNDAERELAQVIHEIDAAEQQGSPEQLRIQLESARNTLRELALNRVSAEARREAIVARIDELRAKGEDVAANDPLIAELEAIVDIRERQLEGVRELRAAGTISATELSEAETEMAKARVELLKAKRTAMADAAGGVMQELNNELSRLIVQLAEIDARSKSLQQQVDELRAATSVGATTTADALNHKLLVLRRRVADLEESKSRLEATAPPVEDEITITPLDEALSLGADDEGDADAAKADQ